MNNEWAKGKLREFIDATTLHWQTGEYYSAEVTNRPEEEILASAQVVEKILDRVTPNWRGQAGEGGLWRSNRAAAIRALAEIENADEVERELGDYAPTLNAAAMHPWVWEAARSLWQSGHFGEAVRASTAKVNAEIQNKVGRRDVSETALVQQCFSDDPPTTGSPRLRPTGDDEGKTAKSRRRGVVAIAEAVFGGIRNPYSHDPVQDVDEQVAVEQLATVSLLARWVDSAEVTRSG